MHAARQRVRHSEARDGLNSALVDHGPAWAAGHSAEVDHGRRAEGHVHLTETGAGGLARLIGWMAGQNFSRLVDSGLLKDVEEIVVAAYLAAHAGASRPDAYRWLRYEDPAPVERLSEGVQKLIATGAKFSEVAVDKACRKASKLGYLN